MRCAADAPAQIRTQSNNLQKQRETFFVTGTDTGVGKTWWALQILRAAHDPGVSTLGLKPVAAGAKHTPLGWRNDDAEALQAASSVRLRYQDINPVCLPLAASPHIAAKAAGIEIDAGAVAAQMRASATQADLTLIEGAGGWLAPVSDRQTMADIAIAIGAPVYLVVGLRLGCLNHALLTAEAIARSGLPLAGWIANEIAADHGGREEQIAYLTRQFGSKPVNA